jgi:hypothetical protein
MFSKWYSAGMFTLEVPITDVDPGLLDPAYSDRHDLVKRRSCLEPTPSSRPIIIGRLAKPRIFSLAVPFTSRLRTLDYYSGYDFNFSIDREAGSAHYNRLPDRLKQFGEAITRIAAHEHGAYPDANYEQIGITIDQTDVKPGRRQRAGSIHRDDAPESPGWSHIYVVSDNSPTEFITNAVGLCEPVALSDTGLEVVIGQPYDIVFANISGFHRSGLSPAGGPRTFLRVTYMHDLAAAG